MKTLRMSQLELSLLGQPRQPRFMEPKDDVSWKAHALFSDPCGEPKIKTHIAARLEEAGFDPGRPIRRRLDWCGDLTTYEQEELLIGEAAGR